MGNEKEKKDLAGLCHELHMSGEGGMEEVGKTARLCPSERGVEFVEKERVSYKLDIYRFGMHKRYFSRNITINHQDGVYEIMENMYNKERRQNKKHRDTLTFGELPEREACSGMIREIRGT